MKMPVLVKQPVDPEPTDVIVQDTLINDDGAVSTVRTISAVRPFPPLDEDGYRACARAACSAHFKPKLESRAFCSEDCTILSFYERQGLKPPVTITINPETGEQSEALVLRRATRGGAITARAVADPKKEAYKTTRYGPLRACSVTLSETPGSRRVQFTECAHEGSVAKHAKRGRCRTCRDAANLTTPQRHQRQAVTEGELAIKQREALARVERRKRRDERRARKSKIRLDRAARKAAHPTTRGRKSTRKRRK